MKSLVFIEHNVVARHFLQSRAFDEFAEQHQTVFVFPEQGHRRISQVDPSQLELPGPHEHLTILSERQITWKWLYLIDQLRWKPGAQSKALRRLHRCNLGWKAAILLTALSLPGIRQGFQWVVRRKLRSLPFDGLRELLDREKPDILIHPCVMEGVFLNDLIEESKRRHIPLVVIMNSWDNPSTKRAMIGNPDWLLVWGEQTHRHAVDLAGMPPERTLKFGAAQFEVYREPPQMDRGEFCDLNDVDPALPLLVYAGSSKGTREIDHLRQLDAAVESGVLPPVNILYRPHPWGNGGEGGANILDESWRHVTIEHSMREYLEQVRAGKTEICLAEYRHTHEVLAHCDALISPLSTIILEAALHGKPAMCFLPDTDQSNHFRHDSQLMHFHDMFEMPEIIVAHSYNELIAGGCELLERAKDGAWHDKMKKLSEFFVEPHGESFSRRLRQLCEKIMAAS